MLLLRNSFILTLLIIIPLKISAERLPPFQWNDYIETPASDTERGNQIFHFNTRNKPYTLDKLAIHFVEKYLKTAAPLTSDASVLRYASDAVTIKGAYIELGVCTGKSINFIAALNPLHTIYGFDSFEGLPENWIRGDKTIPKSTFKFKEPNATPPTLINVELYKGWFKNTLPEFQKSILKDTPIAFLHVDCDLYSSTHEALSILKNNLVPGTIIVFDELYNYPGSENHEWKALNEFLKASGLKAKYLAYNQNHEQVALKLVAP